MSQLPLKFYSHSHSSSDVGLSWTSNAGDFQAPTDIPKVFGGNEKGFSPEDYFALALQNCFIATFKVIASKSKLQYDNVSIHLTLELGNDENQLMIMKTAHLKISITGSLNHERTLRLLEKTAKSCMIHNSVKTKIEFDFEVN